MTGPSDETEARIIAMLERYAAQWQRHGHDTEALAIGDAILGIRVRRDHLTDGD